MKTKGKKLFQLRQMEEKDIPAGMRLKEAANWNQLEEDWKLFLEASQGGSFVADIKGKVVGTAVNINYANHFSWIGMVLVDPSIRRMGIGTTLLKEAIRLGENKGTIRLDATPEGKKLYDTLGFQDQYKLSRYQLSYCDAARIPDPDQYCREIASDDVVSIVDHDENIFDAPRPLILQSLFKMGRSYAWIKRSGDHITGYCMGRPGSNFEQIGPIIAEDKSIAVNLLIHALHQCSGKAVVIDVPDDQVDFRSYIEKIGFHIQRPFIRMYKGQLKYPGKPELQFGIAGPEIG